MFHPNQQILLSRKDTPLFCQKLLVENTKKKIYEEHMAGDLMVLIPLDSISWWTEYRHMISGPVILYEL